MRSRLMKPFCIGTCGPRMRSDISVNTRVAADAGANAIPLYAAANAGGFGLVARRLARWVWAGALK